MAKDFPYYRWYPADAEGDDFYASLTDSEGWTYHRLLNRAWLNDGIPSDLNELARVIGRSRSYVDKVWSKIGRKWVISPRDSAKLVNPRQEEERVKALEKSENNKRPGNANAKKTRSVRDAFDSQRARARADCVSDSVVVFNSSKKTEKPSLRFQEFWERWPRRFGMDAAASAWNSVVTEDNEALVFACLDRFLASGDCARGAVPMAGPTRDKTGWIFDCARDGWNSDWPRAPSPVLHKTKQQEIAEMMDRRIEEAERRETH